jgi:hypothetical protein
MLSVHAVSTRGAFEAAAWFAFEMLPIVSALVPDGHVTSTCLPIENAVISVADIWLKVPLNPVSTVSLASAIRSQWNLWWARPRYIQ